MTVRGADERRARLLRPVPGVPGVPGVVVLVAVLVLVSVVLSCSPRDDTDSWPGARPGDGAAPPAGAVAIETLEWAQLGGLVSVRLRNNSDRVLERAEALVTVVGTPAAASPVTVPLTVTGECCTAADVPPGGEYGFSFEVGADVVATDVEVAYRNVSWSSAGSDGSPPVTAVPHHVYANAEGSVVVADVRTPSAPVDAAVVQAVVEGPDGDLVAVVSGTWFCFAAHAQRRIWMQTYQRLPDDSTVRSVTVLPRPVAQPGGDANPRVSCDRTTMEREHAAVEG